MPTKKAYEEIVDFIAAGSDTEEVVRFQPSEAARARVWELVAREKTTGLTADETDELNHYVELEHIMRLAKARAMKRLSGSSER